MSVCGRIRFESLKHRLRILEYTGVLTHGNHGIFGQTAFKEGATVAVLGSDLSQAASKYATIASKDGNVITLSAAIEGLAAGAILVEVDATSKKIKAIPNALTPYDIVRDANAISVDGDGAYKNDRPVLERRMPAINDAIKAALVAAGCQFKWSNRK